MSASSPSAATATAAPAPSSSAASGARAQSSQAASGTAQQLPITVSAQLSSPQQSTSILAPASCVLQDGVLTATGSFTGEFVPEDYERYGDVVELYVYTAVIQGQAIQLADPRTDTDTGHPPANGPAPSVHSAPGPIDPHFFHEARNFHDLSRPVPSAAPVRRKPRTRAPHQQRPKGQHECAGRGSSIGDHVG